MSNANNSRELVSISSSSSSKPNPTQPKPDVYPSPLATYDQVAADANLFFDTLQSLHNSIRTKYMVPTIGGKPLNLHRLFMEVTSRGGLEKVIKDRRWREVVSVFNFPSKVTSASFVLRKYYISLIYHYEQVYFLQKEGCPISRIGNATEAQIEAQFQAARSQMQGKSACKSQVTGSTPILVGSSMMGTIDGKFDNGYFVTVKFGTEQLKGVLYHVASDMPVTQSFKSIVQHRHGRKRSRRALKDPFRPKSNRSGYNFFFAEHYARLKPSYHGRERAISKRIGHLWSKLTKAEKEVYQEKGVRDKERYRSELVEYKKTSNASKS